MSQDGEALGILDRISLRPIVAEYESAGVQTVLRVKAGGEHREHFHVDVLKKRFRPATPAWEVNATIPEILERLSPLIGKRADVRIFGHFKTHLPDIDDNALIPSTFFEARSEEFSIKLTAGEISLGGYGEPFHTIRWALQNHEKPKDEAFVLIDMIGDRVMVVNENYLIRVYKMILSGFFRIVLEVE